MEETTVKSSVNITLMNGVEGSGEGGGVEEASMDFSHKKQFHGPVNFINKSLIYKPIYTHARARTHKRTHVRTRTYKLAINSAVDIYQV